MRRTTTVAAVAAAAAVAVAAVAAPAAALWAVTGSGNGSASAGSLGKPVVTLGSKTWNSVTINWSTPAGVTPTAYIVKRGDLVLTCSGSNSCTDSGLTASTQYSYTVQVGRESWRGAISDALLVTTDASPVASPSTPVLASTSDSGTAGDKITNDDTPTVTGTAPAGSTVKIYNGSTVIGTHELNRNATSYSVTVSALTDGTHTLTATATASGAESSPSGGLVITVDTEAPTTPNAPTAGTLTSTTAAFSGTAPEAGGVVTVKAVRTGTGNQTLTASGTPATDKSWAATVTGMTPSRTYNVTATQTDTAGNVSSASTATSVTLPS